MKRIPRVCRITAGLSIFLLWSCAGSAPERTEIPGGDSPGTAPNAPVSAALPGIDHGLETQAFRELPGETRDYLATLAEAFRIKDAAFLASQGETQYETDLKFRYDIETYLAMLYRAGSYTEDLPWQEINLPRLDWQQLRGIEYLDWKNRGPVLEIQARLIPLKGDAIPCEIWLLWRLTQPKIQGAYP
jgi:hypothetical protein